MSRSAIELLPISTVAKLRSTQILTSLPQIVSELVQNSLDAGANTIAVGVDCEDWSCWVQDDGCGITKQGLSFVGRPADQGRYGTSKAYDADSLNVLQSFGFRGEALASAADLSCLEICSRTKQSRETWAIILKGTSKVYEGPAIRWRRETAGTVVSVRDAFYNLPVRRRSHPTPTKTIELIRHELVLYALAFPNVTITLENTHDNTTTGASTCIVARFSKAPDSRSKFSAIFGKALVQEVENITVREGEISVEGFISLHGAPSKSHQYIYINRHPLMACDFHRTVEAQFTNSSFANQALDQTDDGKSSARRSPRKAEKKPVYLLNIVISPRLVDNCLEPTKSTVLTQHPDHIHKILARTVRCVLAKHGLCLQVEPQLPSPRKRRKMDAADDSGNSEMPSEDEAYMEESRVPQISQHSEPSFDLRASSQARHVEEMAWTDPITGESFLIDTRTGNSRKAELDQFGLPTPELLTGRRTLRPGQAQNSPATPEWIKIALEANQAFSIGEKNVPIDFSNAKEADLKSVVYPTIPSLPPSFNFQQLEHRSTSHQVTKQDLQDATVLEQIDKKFIACLVTNSALSDIDTDVARTLVLIDQHAADERIRVERYLEKLCQGFLFNCANASALHSEGIAVSILDPPQAVLLTNHEAQQLSSSENIQTFFQAWGVSFADLRDVSKDNLSGDYTQVLVNSVPQVVSEKLTFESELRDLVKEVIARPEHDLPSGINDPWIKALRWLPKQLLDLINSKACRGAVMFNDSLSLSQCERIVQQLGQTNFPFQCAHGRPTLVPLTGLKQFRQWSPKPKRTTWESFSKMFRVEDGLG